MERYKKIFKITEDKNEKFIFIGELAKKRYFDKLKGYILYKGDIELITKILKDKVGRNFFDYLLHNNKGKTLTEVCESFLEVENTYEISDEKSNQIIKVDCSHLNAERIAGAITDIVFYEKYNNKSSNYYIYFEHSEDADEISYDDISKVLSLHAVQMYDYEYSKEWLEDYAATLIYCKIGDKEFKKVSFSDNKLFNDKGKIIFDFGQVYKIKSISEDKKMIVFLDDKKKKVTLKSS